jgi:hypothetical protein
MANRWQQGCQPYALAALYPQGFFIFKDSWYSFLLEAESTPGTVRPEGLGQFKKSISSGLEPATFRLAAYRVYQSPGFVSIFQKH